MEQRTIDRWDQCLDQLSMQPRRQIIMSLMEAPDKQRLSLPDAAMTPGLPKDTREYTCELHHHHLPALADVDYIRWTSEPFSVQRGPRFEEPAAFMRLLLSSGDQLPETMVAGCLKE